MSNPPTDPVGVATCLIRAAEASYAGAVRATSFPLATCVAAPAAATFAGGAGMASSTSNGLAGPASAGTAARIENPENPKTMATPAEWIRMQSLHASKRDASLGPARLQV